MAQKPSTRTTTRSSFSPNSFARLFSCCSCFCSRRPAKLPPEVYDAATSGTILSSEEGMQGSLEMRNFFSPQQRCNYYYRTVTAAMAITTLKLLVYTGPGNTGSSQQSKCTQPAMICVSWSDCARCEALQFDVVGEGLVIRWTTPRGEGK
jgi:hypothetical protein